MVDALLPPVFLPLEAYMHGDEQRTTTPTRAPTRARSMHTHNDAADFRSRSMLSRKNSPAR